MLAPVPVPRPEGAFYLYFRVDGVFDGDVTCAGDVCTRILEEVGVAIVPGEAFGDRASPAWAPLRRTRKLRRGCGAWPRCWGGERAHGRECVE